MIIDVNVTTAVTEIATATTTGAAPVPHHATSRCNANPATATSKTCTAMLNTNL